VVGYTSWLSFVLRLEHCNYFLRYLAIVYEKRGEKKPELFLTPLFIFSYLLLNAMMITLA